ncbi:hypothetical protein ACFFRR_006852 [Megaselia abdita]
MLIHFITQSQSRTRDNELIKGWKFLKRAAETFLQSHGVQLEFGGENDNSGARFITDLFIDDNARGIHKKDRKKLKWAVILPLIILMKIGSLKMTLVPLLTTIVGTNALLLLGVGYIVYYLKFKTLCKIHPKLVQHHSHVWDDGFGEKYSDIVQPPTNHYFDAAGGASLGPYTYNHEDDWSHGKSYNPYGSGYNTGASSHNYLDTISKPIL